jgi:hypothetical protein
MIRAIIKNWDEDKAWASWGNHERAQFKSRVEALTSMSKTEIKRLSRSIFNGDTTEFVLDKIDSREEAESLRHLFESIGADIEFV